MDFKTEKSVAELNEIIKETCNPIISVISEYLQQSGYNNMKMFNDIRDSDVDIRDMTYVFKSSLTKTLKIKSIKMFKINVLALKSFTLLRKIR